MATPAATATALHGSPTAYHGRSGLGLGLHDMPWRSVGGSVVCREWLRGKPCKVSPQVVPRQSHGMARKRTVMIPPMFEPRQKWQYQYRYLYGGEDPGQMTSSPLEARQQKLPVASARRLDRPTVMPRSSRLRAGTGIHTVLWCVRDIGEWCLPGVIL